MFDRYIEIAVYAGVGVFVILAIITGYNAFLLYAPFTDVVAFHGGTFTFTLGSVDIWMLLFQVGLTGLMILGTLVLAVAMYLNYVNKQR